MSGEVLDHPVLVLNKSWTVIGTTTVKDAVVLMSRGSAKAVCTSTFLVYDWEQWLSDEINIPAVPHRIKTPNYEVAAPLAIILSNYNEIHRKSVKFSSRGVYQRDDYTCQYCGQKKRREDLSIDHVIPKSRNGKTSWENCVTACFKCNNKKSDRTPHEAGLQLAKNPVKPNWSPVFEIRKEKRPWQWEKLLKKDW